MTVDLTRAEIVAVLAAIDRERLHTLACIEALRDGFGRDARWLEALESAAEKIRGAG